MWQYIKYKINYQKFALYTEFSMNKNIQKEWVLQIVTHKYVPEKKWPMFEVLKAGSSSKIRVERWKYKVKN